MGGHPTETLHATSIAIDGRAALLTGPSGAGKSDLALRLIDRGATLVSDDYTQVTRIDGQLIASAPDRIRGQMEVRGIGILPMDAIQDVPVALLIDLGGGGDRLPEAETRVVAGLPLPVLRLIAHEASAPIKAEMAMRRAMAA